MAKNSEKLNPSPFEKGDRVNTEIGYIKPREITEEMKDSYIDYAMSVIISRALPDVRDGLKPVHRRILYTMGEMGLKHDAKFRKSATVVGETMGKLHPHGDAAIYDSLARMAQDFSLRYPLIQGQGNFGSIDGDPPSAMRYSEAKLSKIGEEMLKDIEKNTVDFVDNYDGTRREPVVLPSPLPQLLLNGSLGIAVGMATNIPPHNLAEVSDSLIYLIDHPKATTEDLLEFVKGPDFPTGGEIFNQKEIIQAYSQGKGPILTRGKAEIVEQTSGKLQIVISEIPYQVQKSALVEQFANLVQEKKIEGIRDIRDESDKEGLRIVIDLQREVIAQKILNRLYKFSDLQKTFHLNMLALVEGIQPRVLNLTELLNYYLLHRKEVVYRRVKYDLEKAKERAHILEGLDKCLGKIDEVIRVIKNSANREEAKKNLIKRFKLTEIQANAILETKLSALAKLERKKIEDELKEMLSKIKEFTAILKSPQKIKEAIKKELRGLKENFGDERKTKVHLQKVGEIAEEDLIPLEETIITITQGGYIKRLNPATYKLQRRGGKGILGMKTVGEDIVEHFLTAQTHDSLLFFTDSGKVFRTPVYEIPEGTRVAKGRGLLNFLEISPQEKVLSLMPLGEEDKSSSLATELPKEAKMRKRVKSSFDFAAARVGKEIKEIIKELEEFVPQIHLYVMLEDPKWIEALGRISHLVANLMRGLAKVGIRPVLTLKNGVLVPAGVKTGAKEMPVGLLKQLEADIKKFKMEDRKIRVIITHGDNLEGAQKLKEMIGGKFKNAEIVFLNIINNVVGVPAGPNALTIAWCEI